MNLNLRAWLIILSAISISALIVAAVPTPMSQNQTNSFASSPVIEYQIGTLKVGSPDIEFWSDWASDGDPALVTYQGLTVPGDFRIKVVAPGHHVEYQIGTLMDTTETWSAWASNGDIASVTYPFLSGSGSILIKIVTPSCHVEYQVGLNMTDERWSDWASDGDVATVTYNGFTGGGQIGMKAILTTSNQVMIDIDPDTLNLKSKGNWVTCYIELPEGEDVNNIDVSSVKISDINGIPIEIQAEVHPTGVGDEDNDGTPDLMVKFDRSDVQENVSPGNATITVTGDLIDGSQFGGTDTIRVIEKGKK